MSEQSNKVLDLEQSRDRGYDHWKAEQDEKERVRKAREAEEKRLVSTTWDRWWIAVDKRINETLAAWWPTLDKRIEEHIEARGEPLREAIGRVIGTLRPAAAVRAQQVM